MGKIMTNTILSIENLQLKSACCYKKCSSGWYPFDSSIWHFHFGQVDGHGTKPGFATGILPADFPDFVKGDFKTGFYKVAIFDLIWSKSCWSNFIQNQKKFPIFPYVVGTREFYTQLQLGPQRNLMVQNLVYK